MEFFILRMCMIFLPGKRVMNHVICDFINGFFCSFNLRYKKYTEIIKQLLCILSVLFRILTMQKIKIKSDQNV